jgi:hypothetical protein
MGNAQAHLARSKFDQALDTSRNVEITNLNTNRRDFVSFLMLQEGTPEHERDLLAVDTAAVNMDTMDTMDTAAQGGGDEVQERTINDPLLTHLLIIGIAGNPDPCTSEIHGKIKPEVLSSFPRGGETSVQNIEEFAFPEGLSTGQPLRSIADLRSLLLRLADSELFSLRFSGATDGSVLHAFCLSTWSLVDLATRSQLPTSSVSGQCGAVGVRGVLPVQRCFVFLTQWPCAELMQSLLLDFEAAYQHSIQTHINRLLRTLVQLGFNEDSELPLALPELFTDLLGAIHRSSSQLETAVWEQVRLLSVPSWGSWTAVPTLRLQPELQSVAHNSGDASESTAARTNSSDNRRIIRRVQARDGEGLSGARPTSMDPTSSVTAAQRPEKRQWSSVQGETLRKERAVSSFATTVETTIVDTTEGVTEGVAANDANGVSNASWHWREERDLLASWVLPIMLDAHVLSVDNLLLLLGLLVTETQLVIVCDRLGPLTATVRALTLLLHPLVWTGCHALICTVPEWMAGDIVQAPTPYIVGLNHLPADFELRPGQAVLTLGAGEGTRTGGHVKLHDRDKRTLASRKLPMSEAVSAKLREHVEQMQQVQQAQQTQANNSKANAGATQVHVCAVLAVMEAAMGELVQTALAIKEKEGEKQKRKQGSRAAPVEKEEELQKHGQQWVQSLVGARGLSWCGQVFDRSRQHQHRQRDDGARCTAACDESCAGCGTMYGDIGGGHDEDRLGAEMVHGQSCCFMHRVLNTMLFAQYRRSDEGLDSQALLQRTQWWWQSETAVLRLKKARQIANPALLPSSAMSRQPHTAGTVLQGQDALIVGGGLLPPPRLARMATC